MTGHVDLIRRLFRRRPKGCGNRACKSCMALPGRGPWCGDCGADMHAIYPRFPLGEPWTDPCEKCEAALVAEFGEGIL